MSPAQHVAHNDNIDTPVIDLLTSSGVIANAQEGATTLALWPSSFPSDAPRAEC